MSHLQWAGTFLLCCAAALLGSARAETVENRLTVPGGATVKGPSSSATPYIVPVATGVQTVSVFTTGDSVNTKPDGFQPYRMVGIPDGMGGYNNPDGKTFTLVMNHELPASGAIRGHGANGGFCSFWTIDRTTLQVIKVEDFIPAPRNLKLYDTPNRKYVNYNGVSTLGVMQRFCSADLAAPSAYFNPTSGLGTSERIFLNGEETGGAPGGRAFAWVATGTEARTCWELPLLGKHAPENSLACPKAQDKTIVISQNDTSAATAAGQVYVYIGTKTNAGTTIDKAGLTNGKLYGIKVTGLPASGQEDRVNGLVVNGTPVLKGTATPFTLAILGANGDVNNLNTGATAGDSLNANANAAGVTRFLRPEDGNWNINDATGSEYFFVTTDQFDQVKDNVGTTVGRTRLWKLKFTDIANPENGGTITLVLDGTETITGTQGANMMDNITVDANNHVIICEDVGGNAHLGRLLQSNTDGTGLKVLAQCDPARFGGINFVAPPGGPSTPIAASAPFSNDEEMSGVFDAREILGPGWMLIVVQAHYGFSASGDDAELVEGGQLLAIFNPESAFSVPPTITSAPTASVTTAGIGQTITFTAAAQDLNNGETVTYSWNFGDTTTGAGSTVTKSYTAAGTYQVVLTVTDGANPVSATAITITVVPTSAGSGNDSDGDGLSDTFETAAGTNPAAANTPTTVTTFKKLTVSLNFATKALTKDTVTLTGSFPNSIVDFTGKRASIDIGGINAVVNLEKTGRATRGTIPTFSISKPRNGVSTFTATFNKANYKTFLADETLTDTVTTGKPVSIRTTLGFNGALLTQTFNLTYKHAKAGSSATAR